MKRVFTIIIAAATLLAACSKSESGLTATPDSDNAGAITIKVVDNTTRADEKKIEITEIIPDWKAPDWEGSYLMVLLAAEDRSIILDRDNSYIAYTSVAGFNRVSEDPSSDESKHNYTFRPADYTVKLTSPKAGQRMYDCIDPATGETVSYGEAAYRTDVVAAAEEGVAKPYFEGRTTGITVEKRKTAYASVNVAIANTVVEFRFSDAFKGYYPDAELTFTTHCGYEHKLGLQNGTEFGTDAKIWINPLDFTVTGWVKKQNPSEFIEAEKTELNPLTVAADDVAPRYLYTYTFDISTVGSTENNGDGYDGVKITLNSEPAGTITVSDEDDGFFELNPDAKAPAEDEEQEQEEEELDEQE